MKTSPASDLPVVVLIGNYPIDGQESMLRFAQLVQGRLEASGYTVEPISPWGCLGRILPKGFAAKWLGYVDKYILFPPGLAMRLSRIKRKYPQRKIVVHICDHSNAVYAALARRWFPVLVTCHDLLAVRGALGEDTHCPATPSGKLLQAAILRGIGHATYVACISRATESDLIRLARPSMAGRSEVIPLALNYAYRPLPREEAMQILAKAGITLPFHGFVLHVGSGHPRKNREALLHAVARIKDSWPGKIVFAGDRISSEEMATARSLGVEDRLCEVARPDNEVLLALYNAAHGLVFMSFAEGFGWPVLEAQACGCPVICSNRTSVPEVAGEGALIHEPDDVEAIGRDMLRLQEPAVRDALIASGFKNAGNYSSERMMGAYEKIYHRI
ncbi:MAG: glycosyltransferase family 4 protein [Methylacidiphilales bacterium]|nr:glycosyltransferase family 4 protein [Candidatus Methylacidiphilales bacterium]